MSQFIEMFGIAEATKPLADFIEVSFPGEWGQEEKDGSGVKVIRTTNFTNNGKLDLSDVVTRDIDSAKIEKKKLFKGDIILERSGGTNDNPVGRVVYFEEDGVYLFNNFTQLLRCKEGVNSLFIFYSLFNYYQMNKNVIRSMGNKTTGIQNLKMDRYWQIPIADVSIELQKEFESIYRQADKSGFDGCKSQFIEMFKDKKTNGKITDLVDTDIKSVKKSFNKDDLIEYIDISSVNAKSRTLNETTQYIVSSAPSRAQQCVQNGDILVSTVRPINRNVALVDRDLTNLVASTGFCVLRPIDGYREYLLAIVTSDKYTEKMCDIASGGLYPAVNNSDVLSYDIFIPDKDFLHRVTQIYLQADKSGFSNSANPLIPLTMKL